MGKYAIFRPQGFGKSFLLSEMESLFRQGLRDFHGLKIERLWKDKLYDVVRLNFSRIRCFVSTDEYQRTFDNFLTDAFGGAGFKFDPLDELPVMLQLEDWLEERPDASLVLLVDDFDAPLAGAVNDAATFDFIAGLLAEFYAMVKSCDGCLRFFFLTGTVKLQSSAMASSLNDVFDLSQWPAHGTLLGFTRAEVEDDLAPCLADAAARLRLAPSAVLKQLESHCGGYCFERTASRKVFSSAAVVHFLADPVAGFVRSCSPDEVASMQRFLASRQFAMPEWPLALAAETLDVPKARISMTAAVWLVQTGWLTICSVTENNIFLVGFPNEEAKRRFAEVCASV